MYPRIVMDEAPIYCNHLACVSYPREIDSPLNVFSSATKRDDIGVDSFSEMALNLLTSPGFCHRSYKARLS